MTKDIQPIISGELGPGNESFTDASKMRPRPDRIDKTKQKNQSSSTQQPSNQQGSGKSNGK